MKQTLLILTVSFAFAVAALADHAPGHTKTLVLKDKEGAAILGYDPVAYFTDGKPARGNPKFKSNHIVGAIGVSGAKSAAQDEEVAKAGAAAVE